PECEFQGRCRLDHAAALIMSDTTRFISVKFGPIARPQIFLLGDLAGGAPAKGEHVIVQTENGPAIGSVVPTVAETAERRASQTAPGKSEASGAARGSRGPLDSA